MSWNNLTSGLIGALLGSLLPVIFQYCYPSWVKWRMWVGVSLVSLAKRGGWVSDTYGRFEYRLRLTNPSAQLIKRCSIKVSLWELGDRSETPMFIDWIGGKSIGAKLRRDEEFNGEAIGWIDHGEEKRFEIDLRPNEAREFVLVYHTKIVQTDEEELTLGSDGMSSLPIARFSATSTLRGEVKFHSDDLPAKTWRFTFKLDSGVRLEEPERLSWLE